MITLIRCLFSFVIYNHCCILALLKDTRLLIVLYNFIMSPYRKIQVNYNLEPSNLLLARIIATDYCILVSKTLF